MRQDLVLTLTCVAFSSAIDGYHPLKFNTRIIIHDLWQPFIARLMSSLVIVARDQRKNGDEGKRRSSSTKISGRLKMCNFDFKLMHRSFVVEQ